MAAELELIVSGVTGALTGGMVRPLLAPAEAVSELWKASIIERLTNTSERVARKRRGKTLEVTERTAVNALAAAALTDDPVVQEYLAGVVASADPTNDNAHMLALVGRLPPVQLRLHYGLYLAAAMHVRRATAEIEDEDARWEAANALVPPGTDRRETQMVTLISDPELPSGDAWDRAERALDNLRREGLIESGGTYWDLTQRGIISFNMTSFGVDLFAAALGIDIIGFGDLCECDLDVLKLEPEIEPMETAMWESFSAAYDPSSPRRADNTWARMMEQRESGA